MCLNKGVNFKTTNGWHYKNVGDVEGRVHDGVVDDAFHRPAENTLLDLRQALAQFLRRLQGPFRLGPGGETESGLAWKVNHGVNGFNDDCSQKGEKPR